MASLSSLKAGDIGELVVYGVAIIKVSLRLSQQVMDLPMPAPLQAAALSQRNNQIRGFVVYHISAYAALDETVIVSKCPHRWLVFV